MDAVKEQGDLLINLQKEIAKLGLQKEIQVDNLRYIRNKQVSSMDLKIDNVYQKREKRNVKSFFQSMSLRPNLSNAFKDMIQRILEMWDELINLESIQNQVKVAFPGNNGSMSMVYLKIQRVPHNDFPIEGVYDINFQAVDFQFSMVPDLIIVSVRKRKGIGGHSQKSWMETVDHKIDQNQLLEMFQILKSGQQLLSLEL